MSDLDMFRDTFLPNIETFGKLNYATWKRANPGEAAKWEAYRDGILAGLHPSPPALVTKFGKALVAGGSMVSADVTPRSESPYPPPSWCEEY